MKNTQTNNVMKAFLVFSIVLVSMTSFASALGLSMTPSRDNPLQLYPGQSVNVPVNLQNMIGTDDVTLKLSITQGQDVASTSSAEYKLKAGTMDTYATLSVKVPSDAAIGTRYPVTILLMGSSAGEGQVSMTPAMAVTFYVDVVAKTEEQKAPMISNNNLVMVIGVIVIVVLILWFLLGKKKKKRK